MDRPGFELKMRRLWLMAALVLPFCCRGEGAAPQLPALIVFGDSTVDVGTNTYMATLVRSDFAPYGENFEGGKPTGRFTNGHMVPDYLAMKLGLPMTLPYLHPNAEGERLLHGVNFASAASGILQSTSLILNVLPAFEQLKMFHSYQAKLVNLVGQDRASSIISQAMYLVSTGTNDFILNYLINPILRQQYSLAEWSDFVASNQTEFFKQLYAAGARNMVVAGFPPIGCLPAERAILGDEGQNGCVEDLNNISIAYNERLQPALSQLQSTLPGARLLYADIYSYIHDAFYDPSQYGYSEVGRGCCGEGLFATAVFCNSASTGTCSDPSTYMFFDSLHPTEKCYKAIVDQIYYKLAPFFGLKNS
ncbi:hypothetical protein KC19_5G043800 [Ceratodon purpureus]|uniref:GDSL esterase/lipase n=1 Tax=Ceratodon purpureus TaxID=3225 RepID=A0A8T0HZ56_CERPU|nr:hypothetical protein KC19_5G043800 [Ceratodon purpureus]